MAIDKLLELLILFTYMWLNHFLSYNLMLIIHVAFSDD